MTDFLTSDLHFNHTKIIELSHRPFETVEEMNNTLIDNWNDTVGPDDRVWVLGDIVMGHREDSLKLISELQGEINLVPGNHDYCHPMHGEIRSDKWFDLYEAAGLFVFPEQITLESEGLIFDVCHFPYSGDHTDEDRYLDQRPEDNGRILLHGHIHDEWLVRGRQINVGVDVWDFRPTALEVFVPMANAILAGRLGDL